MKHFLMGLLLILNAFLGQSQSAVTDTLTPYLTSCTFTYDQSVEMEYQNGLEVHGHTFVNRTFHFFNDSTFQEVILNEYGGYSAHLNDESGFEPMKNGYEIAVLKGKWVLENDTVVLHYQEELIFDYTAYLNFVHYKKTNPNQNITALRSRTWAAEKKLYFSSENYLRIVDGANWNYVPNY